MIRNKKMKNVLLGLGVIGMLMSAVLVSAASTSTQKSSLTEFTFVDKDNDGICDNYLSGNRKNRNDFCQFTDKDRDGVCDNIKNQGRRNRTFSNSRNKTGKCMRKHRNNN